MRHAKKRHQLNRFTSWHKATIRSLARSLVISQSIKTTLARAKAVRSLSEDLISLAKLNTIAAKRDAFKVLGDHKLVSVLFNEIGPRFATRSGGYTRIIPLGKRRGDDAEMVIFELTEIKKKEPKKSKKDKAAKVSDEKAPAEEHLPQEKKAEPEAHTKEKHPVSQKPQKKFLGGIKNIFKKERDSL